MEQNLHTPEIYDFRQHDRLWQRVNPALEPYPETAAETIPARGGQITQPANSGSLTAAQESQLPGAESNPCCMGSEAAELLEVLEGYIEEELEDQRRYLALARQAPAWARQTLREIAEDEGAHAGGCCRPGISLPGSATAPTWCRGSCAWGTGAALCGSATMRRPAAASTMPGRRTARQTSALPGC